MDDSVINYLDTYCERAGAVGAFGEPINLLTNLFFILAAILSARALLKTNGQGRTHDFWMLVGLMFTIGVGSGLWHWNPTPATLLMDVIPITLFIYLYIISALRRLFVLSWRGVTLWWMAYFIAGLVAQYTLPPSLLNGTIMYIPTYATLALMTLLLRQRNVAVGKAFTSALLVWTASLTFRTIDMEVCGSLQIGTHFLWHTLNAWVLWKLLSVLIQQRSLKIK